MPNDPLHQSTVQRAQPGEVWRPANGWCGMWRTVLEVSEAGVTWANSRGDKGFARWETWERVMVPAHAE